MKSRKLERSLLAAGFIGLVGSLYSLSNVGVYNANLPQKIREARELRGQLAEPHMASDYLEQKALDQLQQLKSRYDELMAQKEVSEGVFEADTANLNTIIYGGGAGLLSVGLLFGGSEVRMRRRIRELKE